MSDADACAWFRFVDALGLDEDVARHLWWVPFSIPIKTGPRASP